MQTLSFSYNWNKKLECDFFTTLRLYNPEKYNVGAQLIIEMKAEQKKIATVIAHKKIMLADINEFIAGLDTGYSVEECKNILRRMYPKANWQTQYLSFVLLKSNK